MIPFEDISKIVAPDGRIRANIVPIFDGDIEESFFHTKIEGREMPVLPLIDQVLFPGVIVPIAAERESSRKLLKDISGPDQQILVFTQLDSDDEPTVDNLYTYGVVARVIKSFEIREDVTIAILQGIARVSSLQLSRVEPYLMGTAELYEENEKDMASQRFIKLMKTLRKDYVSVMKGRIPDEDFANMMNTFKNDKLYINFASTNIDIDVLQKCALLSRDSYLLRLQNLMAELDMLRDMEELRREIDSKTQDIIGRQQREYFLRHQMDVIQEELGEVGEGHNSTNDVENLRQRAEEAHLPEHVSATFEKELQKLARLQPMSPDYSLQYSYLETLLDLPWQKSADENYSIPRARAILERDHFGIPKVKERIVEFLALRFRQARSGVEGKAQVLCLVGPPGTGKTSVCRSVAEALGRPYRRVALGGLHDEAEIRGHRRTYVGALPGRIIQEVIKAGVNNPVFVLDEIDKVQQSNFHGDPSSALLEVLDPEQNCHFHDNFVDIDFDLSQVLFIATANSVADIQTPLLDRMEIIDFSSYVMEEKVQIAERHLLPKLIKNCAIDRRKLKVPTDITQLVINDYTREAGVRQLEKQLAKLIRHRVVLLEEGKKPAARITNEEVRNVLGLPLHNSERAQREPREGVVTGLAWTPVGGEILFIECSVSPGKGTLSLTGNLGDVMKESATLAYQYIRSNATTFGIDIAKLDESNIHIHVPEGATPKDGPSAGITMFVAMVSALTHRRVLPHVAMTGEATLRGVVTPVGGIREKILAARRAGITDVILCHDNQRDIEEIDAPYIEGMHFHYVDTLADALPLALEAKD